LSDTRTLKPKPLYMKFSCSSYLLLAAGADTIEKMAELAAKTGYSGIQIECPDNNLIAPETFSFRKSAEIVRAAAELDIEIHCLNADIFNGKVPLAQKPAVALLKKYVSIAHSLACPLVSFSPPVLDISEDFAGQYEKLIKILRPVSEFAAELDICLAIRPAEKTLTENIDETIDLADDSECKNIGVVYCPEIYTKLKKEKKETPDQVLRMTKGYLVLVQMEKIPQNAETIKKIIGSGFQEYLCDCSSVQKGDVQRKLKENVKLLKKILAEPVEKPKENTGFFIEVSEKSEESRKVF